MTFGYSFGQIVIQYYEVKEIGHFTCGNLLK